VEQPEFLGLLVFITAQPQAVLVFPDRETLEPAPVHMLPADRPVPPVAVPGETKLL
jgi:hypothetical protein